MSRWKVVLIVVLAAPLVVFGAVWAAWAAFGPDDTSTVAANVVLAGTDVGGQTSGQLDRSLDRLAASFGDTAVKITAPDFTIDTTAGELGLSIDRDATRDATFALGRKDPGPLAPLRWAASFFGERKAVVTLDVDRARADEVIRAEEGDRRKDPVEPSMNVSAEKIELVPGTAGAALDVDAIIDAAPGALDRIGRPIEISATPEELLPKVSDNDVQRVVDQANEATSHPLTLRYGQGDAAATTDINGADLRQGFRLDHDGDTPKLGLDPAYVQRVLDQKLKVATNPTGVRFDIVNGVPTAVPGQDAVVCCGETAPAKIAEALLAGASDVQLDTRTVTAAEGVAWANSLGVQEVVGEFTTKHPCCAPRVTNIHRMSDLTKGVIIAPGETFSANDFVGKRTKEKGFVSAPVIEEGKFSEDFGGGVSQWATTTFNAAFFAGLDIPEHKAHSIYISRYPFGREATLAFPSVDLKIHNNTPYGVVIYPTYSNTSITVQIWSTRFATGTQTDINKTSGCGDVKLTRTRVFVDGHTDTNTYRANYNCNPPEH